MEATIIGRGLDGCVDRLERLATRKLPALILGDTGTGKELLARRYVQTWQAAHGRERVMTLNCVGFTDELLRSELFGYVKGAFTDAKQDKQGLVETHDLICLDELGDAGERFQAALLRVVESGEFLPVGATKTKMTQARFIASTNRSRGIRRDLAERFHAVYVPSLAERGEDIVAIAMERCERFDIKETTDRFATFAAAYIWPGNVRELLRVLEDASLTDVLDVPTVPESALTPALLRAAPRIPRAKARRITVKEFAELFTATHSDEWARQEAQYLASIEENYSDAAQPRRIADILERMHRGTFRPPATAGFLRQHRATPHLAAARPNPERDELVALLTQHGSQSKVAEVIGCTREAVRTKMKRLKITSSDYVTRRSTAAG